MWLRRFSLLTLLVLPFCINVTFSQISDRQYASMPTLFHFDDYDNCMLYRKEALYCRITYQLRPENPENPSEIWSIIKEVSSDPRNYRHDQLRHGICVQETCPNITRQDPGFEKKLTQCYDRKYHKMGLRGSIVKVWCETDQSPYPINIYDILFGLFLGLFVMLVLYAWIYDMCSSQKPNQTTYGKLISSFSLSQNWNRLNTVNPDFNALRCIQAVRFCNMIHVIFSHEVAVHFSVPVANPRYPESIVGRFGMKWICEGLRYSLIQGFFMISTWLLTYQFFLDLEGKKKVPIFYLLRSLIKRYIRLTPTLAIIVGVHSTWMVHLSRGPFWDQVVGEEYRACRANGWSNLLYLNNYVHGSAMCSPHHWSMPVDMEFHIITLLLLWLIWNKRNIIFLVLGSILAVHISAEFSTIYRNGWQSTVPLIPENLYDMKVVRLEGTQATYKTSISQMSALVAGVGFGYAFYKYRNKKLFTKKIHVVLWWILSWGAILGSCIFPGLMSLAPGYHQNRLLYHAVYGSVNKSVYIFGTGLFVFGLTQGKGHRIKFFCEWSPTYVLGSLTYSAYLVHTIFQRWKVGIKKTPNNVDDYSMFFDLIGDVAVAYLGALILTLFFEMPIAEFRKQFTSKSTSKRVPISQNCDKEEVK